MVHTTQKLSNLQLELLKLYRRSISEEDLLAIRSFLSNYFADKAIQEANRIWDSDKWDDSKVEEILNAHLRTPLRYSYS